MVHYLLLLTLFSAGCGSHDKGKEDLLKLSVFTKKIPTAGKESARKFIEDQRLYIKLLYDGYESNLGSLCRRNASIGEIKELKGSLSLVSSIQVDFFGEATGCASSNINVWDVYFYCEGDRYLTSMKISKSHIPVLKDYSLCK